MEAQHQDRGQDLDHANPLKDMEIFIKDENTTNYGNQNIVGTEHRDDPVGVSVPVGKLDQQGGQEGQDDPDRGKGGEAATF